MQFSSTTRRQKHVIILGAGFAGITAANYLRSHGISVQVFEAAPRIAGHAASYRDENGFTVDVGAHIFTNRLAASVGYSTRCVRSPQYGESVWTGGRYSSYPFGLACLPRYALSALRSRLRPKKPTVESAADWFRNSFGTALADEVALPLIEAWSGLPAHQLAPAVGEKLPSSILHTMYLRMMGRLLSRTVSIGYCRTLPENPAVVHVYPSDGMGALCQHMVDPIEDCIELETPVEKIYVEANTAVGVRARGQDFHADAVVSTAPVHVLPRLVDGTDVLDDLSQFKYRPMVFVNLMMEGRGLLPSAVVWTPESRFPFLRATETPLQTPSIAPEGKTNIAVDIGCQVGDDIWTKNEEQLAAECLDAVSELIPDVHERFIGSRVMRTPLAYPVFANEYEERRQEFARSTGIRNFYSIGRNGEFDHLLLEDCYWRTRDQMRSIVRSSDPATVDQPEPVLTAK